MDDYADIYYVDTRNAVTDHRHGSSGSSRTGWAPAQQPARTVYIPPGAHRPVAAFPQPAPVLYAPAAPQPNVASAIFGKLTSGQVIEMVAQLFAAIQPLPAAPNATREANTDAANVILYQGALAQHAKRDEQVRTLGSLLARLIG